TPQLASVLERTDADFDNSLERLFALLRIQSISADPASADDCRKAAEHLAADIASIGFATEVRSTDGHPAIVGKSAASDQRAHVLFYGHYDVQPVDPLDMWHRPPFDPAMIETAHGTAITARGACDDKGQLMTFIGALRAWKELHGTLPGRITMLLEGEEESGSPSLVPFLEAKAAELKADLALVCDTGMWNRETP